jgi:uncharacterized protein YukE
VRIGGDVAGLHALAFTLTTGEPNVEEISQYLCGKVDALVHDAGWSGDAADAFRGAWEQDAAAIDELAQSVQLAGKIIGNLAADLDSAQSELDGYVEAASKAGVRFDDSGMLPGPYTEPALSAAKQFAKDAQGALAKATAARTKAGEELHGLLAAINPEVASDGGLGIADLAGLGAVLKGYYVIPKARVESIEGDIAKEKANYKAARAKWKNSPAGSAARRELAADLKEMRATRTALSGELKAAESLSDKFKGGEFLDKSLGDAYRALGGELEADSKLARGLDGIPGLDVALAGLATWAQMKDDHEKGWSWTHALLADGGANGAALAAGIASDFIPAVGPFVSPIISYGVGAAVTEATHEGHWTEHIHDDGVAMGTLEGAADTGKAVWNNDVVGMYHKATYDVEHPVQAAKNVWSGITHLF